MITAIKRKLSSQNLKSEMNLNAEVSDLLTFEAEDLSNAHWAFAYIPEVNGDDRGSLEQRHVDEGWVIQALLSVLAISYQRKSEEKEYLLSLVKPEILKLAENTIKDDLKKIKNQRDELIIKNKELDRKEEELGKKQKVELATKKVSIDSINISPNNSPNILILNNTDLSNSIMAIFTLKQSNQQIGNPKITINKDRVLEAISTILKTRFEREFSQEKGTLEDFLNMETLKKNLQKTIERQAAQLAEKDKALKILNEPKPKLKKMDMKPTVFMPKKTSDLFPNGNQKVNMSESPLPVTRKPELYRRNTELSKKTLLPPREPPQTKKLPQNLKPMNIEVKETNALNQLSIQGKELDFPNDSRLLRVREVGDRGKVHFSSNDALGGHQVGTFGDPVLDMYKGKIEKKKKEIIALKASLALYFDKLALLGVKLEPRMPPKQEEKIKTTIFPDLETLQRISKNQVAEVNSLKKKVFEASEKLREAEKLQQQKREREQQKCDLSTKWAEVEQKFPKRKAPPTEPISSTSSTSSTLVTPSFNELLAQLESGTMAPSTIVSPREKGGVFQKSSVLDRNLQLKK